MSRWRKADPEVDAAYLKERKARKSPDMSKNGRKRLEDTPGREHDLSLFLNHYALHGSFEKAQRHVREVTGNETFSSSTFFGRIREGHSQFDPDMLNRFLEAEGPVLGRIHDRLVERMLDGAATNKEMMEFLRNRSKLFSDNKVEVVGAISHDHRHSHQLVARVGDVMESLSGRFGSPAQLSGSVSVPDQDVTVE
jgi:hypothetical protein